VAPAEEVLQKKRAGWGLGSLGSPFPRALFVFGFRPPTGLGFFFFVSLAGNNRPPFFPKRNNAGRDAGVGPPRSHAPSRPDPVKRAGPPFQIFGFAPSPSQPRWILGPEDMLAGKKGSPPAPKFSGTAQPPPTPFFPRWGKKTPFQLELGLAHPEVPPRGKG